MERKANRKLLKIVTVGIMAALTFALSHIEIPIPTVLGISRIHLGNSMCILAGLLFGGVNGGLAGGIGSFFYDLTNPLYIASAPFTFLSKFAMGYAAGKIGCGRKIGNTFVTKLIAAVVGQLVYIFLYLSKTYVTNLLLGNASETALADTLGKLLTSSVNAVIAVAIALPLYGALYGALSKTQFLTMFSGTTEKKKLFTPVTAALTAFAVMATALYTINLSAQTKLEKAEEEREAALEERLCLYEERIERLEAELGLTYAEPSAGN